MAIITKYHKLGGLQNRNIFLQNSEGKKSKVKGSVALVSSKASLLGLQMATLLCPHMLAFLWTNLLRTSVTSDDCPS